MRLLFELSGEHETLPRSEVLACIEAEGQGYDIVEDRNRVLVLDTEVDPQRVGERVSLAHNVNEHIASGTISELEEAARDAISLEGSVAIRLKDLRPRPEREDASEALERLGAILTKQRSVDLKNPDNEIRLILGESNHLALKRAKIDRPSFQQRKVDNRPFFSPISLHPKYARALINLARASRGVGFLDPFCGTGGILIEAGMIGAKLVGSDIKEEMINGCRENLQKYDLNSTLFKSDVGEIKNHIEAVPSIATDPPYGRSSSTMREDPASLYERSFSVFNEILQEKGYLAIVLPREEFIEIGKRYMRLEEVHKQRVHKSLDRFYCVFRNH